MHRNYLAALALLLLLASCAPVLGPEITKRAALRVPFPEIQKDPEPYRGKLYLLGGRIVRTRMTPQGSLIEAVHVPVDSRGYLKDLDRSRGRFLALYPREKGFLDPLVYRRDREITLAATLVGTRSGKIDGMEYVYPLFRIQEIHLWQEPQERVPPLSPFWYDPYHGWYDFWWWHGYPPPPHWYPFHILHPHFP